MSDMSRMPVSDISSVRGIGVADIVSTSTPARSFFIFSLWLHAEALLLVDHEQAEVLELDVLRQEPVGADDHVDGAALDVAHHRLGLLGGEEPGEDLDAHRVAGEALAERLAVLVGEQRGRHEDGDLLAVLHRLEGGPHGDLGLAEADVAADEAVHGPGPLHVGLDVVDGLGLVGRLLVGERLLHLRLPGRVGREGVPGGGHPPAVEDDELLGDLLDGLLTLARALDHSAPPIRDRVGDSPPV